MQCNQEHDLNMWTWKWGIGLHICRASNDGSHGVTKNTPYRQISSDIGWMVVAVVKVEIHVYIYICIGIIYWLVVGGLEHEFYFPFHIWVVILPIDFHIFQDGYCTTNQIKHVGDIWWLQWLPYFSLSRRCLPMCFQDQALLEEAIHSQWIGLRENLQESPIF